MFRVRLISDYLGVDEGDLIHATRQGAVRAARLMLGSHAYPMRAEIRQFVDGRFRQVTVVGVLACS